MLYSIKKIVQNALKEDIGKVDVSSSLLTKKRVTAKVLTRENTIISGCDYFNESFYQLNNNTNIKWLVKTGQLVKKNNIICNISGDIRSILSAERVALNFLQTFCATANHTYKLVSLIKHTKAKLLDTRKTIPNLRLGQKQAVLDGGGYNHRFGLYDAVLIKENHLAKFSIENITTKAKKKYPTLPIIVEVDSLELLKKALILPTIDRILCDNFSLNKLKIAVKITNAKKPLEASGNIDKNNIKKIAETGINFISIGGITKNIKAVDLSLTI